MKKGDDGSKEEAKIARQNKTNEECKKVFDEKKAASSSG